MTEPILPSNKADPVIPLKVDLANMINNDTTYKPSKQNPRNQQIQPSEVKLTNPTLKNQPRKYNLSETTK